MRRSLRILGLGLLLLTAAYLLLLLVGGTREQGTAVCTICGAVREETRICGLLVYAGPAAERAKPVLDRYNRWFESTLAVSHSHRRRRIGCWAHGWTAVGCSVRWGEPFYGVVPDLPDQEMARALAVRMLHASPPDQQRLLQYCEGVRCGTLTKSMEIDLPPEVVERLAEYESP